MSGNEAEAPMMWNANYGGPLYSFTTYGKAPLMLSMLGGDRRRLRRAAGDERVREGRGRSSTRRRGTTCSR